VALQRDWFKVHPRVSLRRWLPSATVALVAHLAALGMALRAPVRGPAATEVDPTVIDLQVELAAAEAPPVPRVAVATSEENAVARAAPTAERRATGEPPRAAEAPEPSAQPSTAAPPSDGWTFDPRRPTDLLAPAGIARAVREGLPASEPAAGPGRASAPTGVSKTGGLAEGLDAHDASLGLGRGGPVVSALEVAAASSDAAEGHATFDVAIDSSGRVSVALLDASAARGAWTKVGTAAGASLDPKRVRIPPGAQGWHVVATVEAKVQYPNGVEPKQLGTRVDGSASPALKENEHRASVEDAPLVFQKTPGVTVAHAGKVCSVAITLGLSFSSGISGGCDPSNIGSRALRVVRGHVVSEGRL
jgi:hypothetical protein